MILHVEFKSHSSISANPPQETHVHFLFSWKHKRPSFLQYVMSTAHDSCDVLLSPTPLPSHALDILQVMILPLHFLLLSPLSIFIATWARDLKNGGDPSSSLRG